MQSYTVTTTNEQDLAVQSIVDKVNAGRPLDEKGDPVGAEITASQYLQARFTDVLASYLGQYHAEEADRRKAEYLASVAGTPLSDLDTAKAAKLAEVLAVYQGAINAGITPAGQDFTLAAEQNDQAQFTKLITLLREVEELQPSEEAKTAFRASPVTIVDKDGVPHQLTVLALRGVIVDYGNQINTLWAAYAAKRAQVAAAQTVEAVAAIK